MTAEPPLTRERCRALLSDGSALPTGLSLRFAVLVLVITATTATVYGHLALLLAPGAGSTAQSCFGQSRWVPMAGDSMVVPAAMRGISCARPFAGVVTFGSVLGVVLVAVVSVLVYFAQPWFLARTWSWNSYGRRLDEVTDPVQLERLSNVVGQLGLPTPPRFLRYPYEQHGRARTFGTHRQVSVRVDHALLGAASDRAFTGILLHELAHVRNRDCGPTYLTIAAWRTFVALVIVPYLGFLALSGPVGGSSPTAVPSVHQLISVAMLFVLVYLTTASVLRARETLADSTADSRDPRGTLRSTIREAADERRRRPLIRVHPTTARRLAALRDPTHLVASGAFALFGVGVGVSLIAMTITIIWSWVLLATGAFSDRAIVDLMDSGGVADGLGAMVTHVGPAAVITLVLLAGFVSVTGWRDAVVARHTGRRVSPGRRALPVAAGFMVGEPLSAVYANAGTFGVFDIGLQMQFIAVALTFLGLTVMTSALAQWVGESATAWLSTGRTSLRQLCWTTAAVAVVAGFPFMLVWLTVHNNMAIRYVTPVYAIPEPLASWPMADMILTQYLPLLVTITWPTTTFLVLLAVLWTVHGSRAGRAPTVFRAAVVRGPIGASIMVVFLGGLGWVVNTSGVDVFSVVNTMPDASRYVANVFIILVAVGSVATGVWSSWHAGEFALSAGVLGTLLCSTLAALAAPVIFYVTTCGPSAFTCMGNNWPGVDVVFMYAAVLGTALSVVLSVPILLLIPMLRRPIDRRTWPRSGAAVLATAAVTLLGGLVAHAHIYLRWR